MGLDFDILEHCKKVRAEHGPPYACPIQKCGRTYKSVCGLQYHLKSYDHDNPTPETPKPVTPKNKKGRSRVAKAPPPQPVFTAPEPLTYEEAQKMVQFELGGHVVRLNINEDMEVVTNDELPDDDSGIDAKSEDIKAHVPLPEASYKEMENYNICDAPARPNAYIRFIEKSAEELDGEVEYDVDEEDTAWLQLMNKKREDIGLSPVSVDSLELLMDRLEKESYFQASVNGHTGSVVDDDAVCCICMDGECQNTNVILFCDMCNLAVHQDCYGVPYIPEGQWLCRRCLQSPSRAVDCVLCPNQGGAFKQTDRSEWAHVVCALWIPEVRFANTVFLEPIDSIETIPSARWKLSCYVCKQKGVGACIQCHKTNCYSAFHVTCAQQAGLYMKMDTVKDSGGDSQPVLVQKIAYCDIHAPPEFNDAKKDDAKTKMKQARKMLAKKRGTVPVILIPTIPPERIQEIGSLVTIQKKSQFIQRLIAYWTLKRQFRNGVPLLRRLQSAQGGTRDSNTTNVDTLELCRQLKYWQCLRQDLERARLLCELVRKREKLKLELLKATEKTLNVQLRPLEASLRKILELISAKDTNEIFSEPVDLEEVPDYTTVVTDPMDLSTMRLKLENSEYESLTVMEKDFDLMIANCLAYNNKDTVFYKAGIKMREQCGAIFKQGKKDLEAAGLLSIPPPPEPVVVEKVEEVVEVKPVVAEIKEVTSVEIDKAFEALKGKKGAEILVKLEDLMAKSHTLRHGMQRAKRVKMIRSEMMRIRRALAQATDSSQSDGETEVAESKTPSQGSSAGASPTGVNRRTAVLFTRKAQAALKKPADEKEIGTEDVPSPVKAAPAPAKTKKKGRPKRVVDTSSTTNTTASATTSTILSSVSLTKSEENVKNSKNNMPDSFRVYRARQQSSGDENSDSGTSLSTCYSRELSEIESDDDSDTCHSIEEAAAPDDDEEEGSDAEHGDNSTSIKGKLKPLQLVWAKCRGYPWYPALIIDPEMPKGYVYQGVPIPSPPKDVLALSTNYNEHVYLVLFFDAKRTWQWLPAEKLELLGIDEERDESKVNEPRKPTDKKAVRRAYQNALNHQSIVKEKES
ncbi:PREDICTED: peregrin isoform X2 [Nicrophorus vespilloides]|uniref:Peregrin isoform X2 n=1 Tax=Nicrophorus vespilloides TaxID=110193 RepID=A0ABM1N3L7_NICVS|nr:PREDICTED: peregrin isoform X2 [Nicrophorus vespilloides]